MSARFECPHCADWHRVPTDAALCCWWVTGVADEIRVVFPREQQRVVKAQRPALLEARALLRRVATC